MGEYGDRLEANIGALFKPIRSDWEKTKAALDLAMAIGGEVPVVGLAIRLVAWQRAWFGDGKKAERVTLVLLGLQERLAKLEAAQKDYLRTEDAQAVLEEAFARIGDQPDEARQEAMRTILLKIIDKPQDTASNRLFLRLADELPWPAMRLLNAAHASVDPHAMSATKAELIKNAELSEIDGDSWLSYLTTQGLIDEDQLSHQQYMTFEKVLTALGRAFAEYRRG